MCDATKENCAVMMTIRRFHSIEIVKGIAMIMVILVHYGQNYQICIAKACQYLRMGCPAFFVASGFGIMCLINNKFDGQLDRGNVAAFYFSRFKALAPGWYITFVVVFLVNTLLLCLFGKTLSFGSNRDTTSIICNLLFLNGLLPFCNNNVMPGGWYIGTTVILYALTPLILRTFNKSKNKRFFFVVSSLLGMLIWATLFFLFRYTFSNHNFGYYFFLVHYPEYLLGIMLFYDIFKQQEKKDKSKRCLAYGIGLLVVAVILFYTAKKFSFILSSWTTALAAYFFLRYMISNEQENELEQNPWARVCESYGKNSYCIYLIHAFFAYPLVWVLLKIFEKIDVPILLSFFILIPITLISTFFAGVALNVLVRKVTSFFFTNLPNKNKW